MSASRPLSLFASLFVVAALAACGGGGGDATSMGMTNSTLNLGLTDGPLDGVTKVWVQFTGVEVQPVNGNSVTFSFSPARGFDLKQLTNGATATFLNGATVPAGDYDWVRLMIDTTPGSTYVINSTGQHNLFIPSGFETGLKLIRGFTMPAGSYTAAFTCEPDDSAIHENSLTPPTIHFVTYPSTVTITNGMTTTANL